MKSQLKQNSDFHQHVLTDATRSFEALYNSYLRKAYEQCIAPVINAGERNELSQTRLIPVPVPSRPFSDKN